MPVVHAHSVGSLVLGPTPSGLARRKVWLAQSPLSEACRKTLRTLPVVSGQMFGPAAQQALERSVQVNKVKQQFADLRQAPLPRPRHTLGVVNSFQGIQYSVQASAPQVQRGPNDHCQGPLRSLAQKQEISVLGAIERVKSSDPMRGFYLSYFLVPKKDGSFRPILNLRRLNQFIKVLRFHILRTIDVLQVVSEGDWFRALI